MSIGELVGMLPDIRTFEKSNGIVDNRTYVGVEVEVENMRRHPNVNLWNVKEDGSLRNSGAEYTFATPLMGADIVTAITQLYKAINQVGGVFSERCGLHVHLDVRDMSEKEYISLVYHTLLAEKSLYKYCGKDRDNNVFCLPHYKAKYYLYDMGKFCSKGHVKDLLRYGVKYMGTNLAATKNYGSVEYRMHPGVSDPALVLNWINILLCIRKYAVANADKVDNFLQALTGRGVVDYVLDMFREVPHIHPFVERDDVMDSLCLLQTVVESVNIEAAGTTIPRKLTNVSLIRKFFDKHGYKIQPPESLTKKTDYVFKEQEVRLAVDALAEVNAHLQQENW